MQSNESRLPPSQMLSTLLTQVQAAISACPARYHRLPIEWGEIGRNLAIILLCSVCTCVCSAAGVRHSPAIYYRCGTQLIGRAWAVCSCRRRISTPTLDVTEECHILPAVLRTAPVPYLRSAAPKPKASLLLPFPVCAPSRLQTSS